MSRPIIITKRSGERVVQTRESGGFVERPTSGPSAVKTTDPKTGKSTIVTRTGQVTVKDKKGKVIQKFQATPQSTRQFISQASAQIRQQVATQRQKQPSTISIIESEALKRFAISPKIPQVKTIRDKEGRIIAISDPLTKQSYRTDNLNLNKRDIAVLEGRFINQQRKQVEQLVNKLATTKTEFTPKQLFNIVQARKKWFEINFKQGRISATEKEKGLNRLSQILSNAKQRQIQLALKTKSPAERQFRSLGVLGLIGAGKGVVSFAQTIKNPVGFAKGIYSSLKNPVQTIRILKEEFLLDPAGVVAEYVVFSKLMGLSGKLVKKSPVGRFVQEEIFIRSQPKEIRPFVRKIIKSSKVQEKINPLKVKSIKKIDFMEIKGLTKLEIKALRKALKNTDSVVFGSVASRTLSGKKTPIPKDVDLATKNINTFNNKFLKGLPKNLRKNYKLVGEKIIRISDNRPLFDVKPLSRLIPEKSLLSGRGQLPVAGFKTKLKFDKLLPKFAKQKTLGKLKVPTQKIVKVEGIKLTGFGEQTTRKGLGTLQVLVEKNIKRAKDPQAFILGLEIQLQSLKLKKPKNIISKILLRSKILNLESSINLLKSKQFLKLLENKTPGILKQYPILNKLNPKKIRKVNFKNIKNYAKELVKSNIKISSSILSSKIPSKLSSSIIATSLLKSGVPLSKIKNSKIFKSKSNLKSFISKSNLKKITSSKVKKTKSSQIKKVPSTIKKVKPSKIKKAPSRVPFSPLSKLQVSKLYNSILKQVNKEFPTPKNPKEKKKIQTEKQKKIIKLLILKLNKSRKFLYIPDLYSILYGIKANPKEKKELLKPGKVFTGLEVRKLIR